MRFLHRKSIGISVGLLSILLFGFLPHAFAFTNGQPASIVIGEPSLSAFDPGATTTGMVGPAFVAFDSHGDLWVADGYGNRVLEYKAPLSTHEAASVVIGQSSFTALSSATTSTGLNVPNALAFDPSGNLWVVDSSNNRVLEYKAPFTTGEAASLVIGQSSMTVNYYSVTNSTSLNSPNGIAFDSSGNLWVADLLNGRVLEYKAPFSTYEAASLVIGEPSFTVANDEVSKKGLNAPNTVEFDSSGDLWVVDGHRVLEYNAPFSTYEPASLVIGQNTFTNSSTVTSATGLNMPAGLAFDPAGNLWVSDKENSRVLEYTAPFSTFEAATTVIGQMNFTYTAPPFPIMPTPTGLAQPGGIAFDSSGNLWVADGVNDRVVEFASSYSGVTGSTTSSSASVSTASTPPSSTTSSSGATTASSTTSTNSVAITTSSSSSSSGGGVPEYPYQFAVATVFTLLLAASYLLVRHRTAFGGHGNQEIPAGA